MGVHRCRRPLGGRLMRRGDVVWVDLDPVQGSEASKRRPAVVVQLDTTIIIHPGQRATVDDHTNLLIATGEETHAG